MNPRNIKFIFVTGGVMDDLGKSLAAASLARLLKARGLRVTMLKLDPRLNVDIGDISSYQNAEVFVTADGAEADADIGNYERFLDESLNANCNVTAGKVYWSVLSRERRGDYLGARVKLTPHITDEIKERIYRAGKTSADVAVCEIGGIAGDLEGALYMEAARQVAMERGREHVIFMHLAPAAVLSGSPHHTSVVQSVHTMIGHGIQPDMILCRADMPLSIDMRDEIALACNLSSACVFQDITTDNIYKIPLLLEKEGLDGAVCRRLGFRTPDADMKEWEAMVKASETCEKTLAIGLVGKYVSQPAAYVSVTEALRHAGIALGVMPEIRWIDPETVNEENALWELAGCHGIVVPSGCGERGIDGILASTRFAREDGLPFLGLALGMQMAVVELARSAAGLTGAHSTEIDPSTPYPVIDIMPEHKDHTDPVWRRLGLTPCCIEENSAAAGIYHKAIIYERHRNCREVMGEYREKLRKAGLRFTGNSPDGKLCEIIELPGHPFFIGVMFHPEFLSRPDRPHPLFSRFVQAALAKKEKQ